MPRSCPAASHQECPALVFGVLWLRLGCRTCSILHLHRLQDADVGSDLLVGEFGEIALLDNEFLGQDADNNLQIFDRLFNATDADDACPMLLKIGGQFFEQRRLQLVSCTSASAPAMSVVRNTGLEKSFAQLGISFLMLVRSLKYTVKVCFSSISRPKFDVRLRTGFDPSRTSGPLNCCAAQRDA